MSLRLGLTLGVAGLPLADALDLARRAEAAGFDTLALGEAAYDAFGSMGAVAAVTSRVRLVSAVATWIRPPVATARAAATIAELSGGRYVLGLGTMPAGWNARYYGIDPARPIARMREYVAVVRAALGGGPVCFEGEFYRVDGYRPLHAPAAVPIHLAATLPGMARLAGDVADGVLYNVVHTPRWLREVLAPAVGSEVERGVMVRCVIDDDEERALALARRSLALYLDVPYFREVALAEGFAVEPSAGVTGLPAELVRRMCLLGPPAACLAGLQRYEGLVDWVDLAPGSGLDAVTLAGQYEALLSTFGGA